MRTIFPLTVYCISLLFSQLLALPVSSPLGKKNRLDFMTRLHQLRERSTISLDVTEQSNTDHGVSIDRKILWRAILSKSPPSMNPTGSPLHITQAMGGESTEVGGGPKQIGSRSRRHVHSRGHHNHHNAQLMRVGCVLGTCQVQNLSHRLYQLVGQSGREDSSPINPRSPHSYG
ncbi:protein ADM2a [Myxocyprinus asiaticus]|uniref:protein ADM2a n=1 Tax=Myxocyprinus asiaticus TaxID=70543 RepID=UPI00222140FC|nr:protein ADM2a [Myxocyprinus asiaticus]XP_051544935.1 protein ADM2a [Myxocyprinus asiaticus]